MINILILIIFVIILMLLVFIRKYKIEKYDQQNTYPYYREPYSILLWTSITGRQSWNNLFNSRSYNTLNNKMIIPNKIDIINH